MDKITIRQRQGGNVVRECYRVEDSWNLHHDAKAKKVKSEQVELS
jgi:hypothetical protein